MTLKGQCDDPDNFRAHYLEHSFRYRLGYYRVSTGNFKKQQLYNCKKYVP